MKRAPQKKHTNIKIRNEKKVNFERDSQKSDDKDCHKLVQFLWSGYGRNIVTSDAGMYGELREGSLRQIFSYLSNECMLNELSILCDIGSGRGCPNIVASFETNLGASIGIELGKLAHILAQKNKLFILEREINDMVNNNQDPNYTTPKQKLSFLNMDASYIQTLEPITHIFSFDAAMPGWLIFHLCKIFNQSQTTFCYCSFRPNLIEEFWLNGFKKKVLHGSMSGSGEGRTCHIYLKYDWEQFSSKAYTYTAYYLNNKSTSSICETNSSMDVSLYKRYIDPSNFAQAVEVALLPASYQQALTNQQIEDWYSNKTLRSSLHDKTHQIRKAQLEREAYLIEQTEKCDPLDNLQLTTNQCWEARENILKEEVQRAWKQIGSAYAGNKWIIPKHEPPLSFFYSKESESWLSYFEGWPLPNLTTKNPVKELFLMQNWTKSKQSTNIILKYFSEQYNLDYKLDSASFDELISQEQYLNWHPIQSYWKWSIRNHSPSLYKPFDEQYTLNKMTDTDVTEIIKQGKKVYLFNRIKKFLPVQWEATQISRCLNNTIWWVQCDKCSKWRKIPNMFPNNEREMIQKNVWECKMIYWDNFTPNVNPCNITCDWKIHQYLYEES